jgi:hypothetical protein
MINESGEVTLNLSFDEAFDHCLAIAAHIDRYTVKQHDRRAGQIEIGTKASWLSNGEIIQIRLKQLDTEQTWIEVTSRPFFKVTLYDYGLNKKNVETILSALQSKQAASSPSPPPTTQPAPTAQEPPEKLPEPSESLVNAPASTDTAVPSVDMARLVLLTDLINRYFSVENMEDLCFRLHLDYHELPGQSKLAKVRNLVLKMDRKARIPELVALLQQLRPNVEWE